MSPSAHDVLTGPPRTLGRPVRTVASGLGACALTLLLATACGAETAQAPGPEQVSVSDATAAPDTPDATTACPDGPRIVLRRSEPVVPTCREAKHIGYPGAAGQPLE